MRGPANYAADPLNIVEPHDVRRSWSGVFVVKLLEVGVMTPTAQHQCLPRQIRGCDPAYSIPGRSR